MEQSILNGEGIDAPGAGALPVAPIVTPPTLKPAEMGAVKVNFVKRAPVEVNVDIDRMTWEDYKKIQGLTANVDELPEAEMMEKLIDVINLVTDVDLRTYSRICGRGGRCRRSIWS
jgi:hypothetical protein